MSKDVKALLDAGGILIGSQALGVSSDNSDYDVAILRGINASGNTTWPPTLFFKSKPV